MDPPHVSDDEVSPQESESEPESALESEIQSRNKRRKSAENQGETVDCQHKFACMQKSDKASDSENPNARSIEVLQQMLDYYTRTADEWRVLSYRRAINALRRQPNKVVSRAQALSMPGIGPRLADKIEEIVWTNRLRRLENASSTPEDRILQKFLGIYGVGISQASRWVAEGFRSLEDLRDKASLTINQRIGIEHYNDFAQRIPRQEVAIHGEIVRQAVHATDPAVEVIIGGSYRRGASNSGDIDLLITKPDATIEYIRTIMLDVVVPQLFEQDFLMTGLSVTSRADGSKWHGASVSPGSKIWRRIDLLFVPGSQIGAALIYFTGNDIFNRSMRLLASKKGMCLNQRGLYTDVLRSRGRVKLAAGHLIEGRDEERIFMILGVPWRPPEQRIC